MDQPSSSISPPTSKKKCWTRTSDAWLRKPSQSSWVKVKQSLSPLRSSLPRDLGAGMSQKHSGQAQGMQSSCQK